MSLNVAHDPRLRGEARTAQRHDCEVATTCQPPSAWVKDPWPAVIRNIGAGGASLTLGRRFERGSGLAIELPSTDGSTSTVLGRVVHVSPFTDGGWLLGVSFISELSAEEVEQVLQLSAFAEAQLDSGSPAASTSSITGVLFEAIQPNGEMIRWFVKRLDHVGDWPPPVGKTLGFRFEGQCLSLIVVRARPSGSCWVVNCHLTEMPSPAVVERLSRP